MAQPKANVPTRATEVVGKLRGGPAHMTDGIGPGKGTITSRRIVKPIVPQTSTTLPEGSGPNRMK